MVEKNTTKTTAKTAKQIEPKESVDMTQLMKMMEDMQKQILSLSAQNTELEKKNSELVTNPIVVDSVKSENIEPNEYINVMSLIDHTLNISTQGYGQGEAYKFVEYAEIQPIIYSDLSRIISNNKHFLEKNIFVVLDERVNKRHQLKRYSDIVTKDMIDGIIRLESEKVDELFSQLSDEQKDNVVDIIIKNAFADNGESVSYNKLRKMSKHYKRNIQEMLDEALELEEKVKKEMEE